MPNKPGTRLRGYGVEHTARRRQWKPKVDRGGVPCAWCGIEIPPAGEGICPAVLASGQRCLKNHHGWDLGHQEGTRNQWTGPEHQCCNRGKPGIRRGIRARVAKVAAGQHSRVW